MKMESKLWIVETPVAVVHAHPETKQWRQRGYPYTNREMALEAARLYDCRVVERITITTEKVIEDYSEEQVKA